MNLSNFFIQRAITTTLLMASISVFGALSYLSLPVSNLPEVEYPTIQVAASLSGANPDTMASTVATPLESELSAIPGVQSMTSSSSVGQSNITLQFDLNRSVDSAAQDVQAAISRAQGTLPADMPTPPSYSKVNPAQDPILWLEMSSRTMAFNDFAEYANRIFAKRLSMVSGVSQVEVYGPERPAIRVQADPEKLAAFGLDLEQVRAALVGGSTTLPAGTLYGESRDVSLQADSQLDSAEQFSQLIVAYRNGAPLRLNQVADVISGSSNEKSRFWINGKRSVILAVRKQPGANTVEVADRLKGLILSLQDSMPPGVTFGKVADTATTVRESISEVNRTLLLTIGLVVAVIFFFLGSWSATAIASISIPISILGTFIVMRLLGYSVDMFSMMAITLSIGFIVDDSIVMIENIVRHREMGETREQAAIAGAREVGFTILSMTVSLVAVFLPVLFLGGVLGRLLREFAVTISVAILLSGLTSLTLTPMLCSRFLRSTHQEKSRAFRKVSERIHGAVERLYQRSLNLVLRHRRLTLLTSAAMTALTIYLFAVIPKSFVPAVDVGYFNGTLEASQGNSFAQMVKYAEQVNSVLARMPWMESNLSGTDSQNAGWFHVNLIEDRHRPNVKTIMANLQKELNAIPGLNIYLRQGDFLTLGQNEGRSQYSAALEGLNAQELYHWAPLLKGKLQSLPQLENVSTDLQLSAPRVSIDMKRDLGRSLDVDPVEIANTLYDAYGNRRASAITVSSERHDVILEVAERYQLEPESMRALYVRSSTGHLVPLSAVTALTETVAPLTANHVGQFPAVTFQFDLAKGVSLGTATDTIQQAARNLGMPATITFAFQGTAAQFQSSLRGLGLLLAISVMVIYGVLGILYESFIHPITILSGLPPAAVGALITLSLCGEDLNLYSFIGIILLIGIVKKNAIMIVDFALDAERTRGMSPQDAVYQGCLQRFRPIMMTTMAALLGAIPIALGSGVGGEARRPLGIAVVGGLLVSQSLTLYLTPVIYLCLQKLHRRKVKFSSRETALLITPASP